MRYVMGCVLYSVFGLVGNGFHTLRYFVTN